MLHSYTYIIPVYVSSSVATLPLTRRVGILNRIWPPVCCSLAGGRCSRSHALAPRQQQSMNVIVDRQRLTHGSSLTGSTLLTKFCQSGPKKPLDMTDRDDVFLRAKHRTFGGLSEGKLAPLTSLRRARLAARQLSFTGTRVLCHVIFDSLTSARRFA